MAVRLYDGVRDLIDKGADYLTEEMVSTAASLAPIDTGQLSGSIHKIRIGLGEYIISTNAYGHNGVEYAAKIETGESVVGYQHFTYRGKEFRVHAVAGSKQSHFMSKTVSKYGG